MLNIGDTAPNFTLPDQDGKLVSLNDFAGKWRVVYFYPKDDTPGCTTEACNFRDVFDELDRQSVIVLGISKDTVTSHKKFRDKYSLNFTLLSDEDHGVIERYGAWQEKNMFGKKYMGIIRMTYIVDPVGKIVHHFPRVTPEGHEQEVLSIIKKLSKL